MHTPTAGLPAASECKRSACAARLVAWHPADITFFTVCASAKKPSVVIDVASLTFDCCVLGVSPAGVSNARYSDRDATVISSRA